MLRIDVDHRNVEVLCIEHRTCFKGVEGSTVEVHLDAPGVFSVVKTTCFSWKHALAITRNIERALALGWNPLSFLYDRDRQVFLGNELGAERFAKEIPQLAEIFYPEGT